MLGRHEHLRGRDGLFLLAHDEDHGWRPRIHVSTLAVGLAGADLIDLCIGREVSVRDGAVKLGSGFDLGLEHQRANQERLLAGTGPARPLIEYLVAAQAWVRVRNVITAAAHGLYERTQQQLIDTGLLAEHKGLLGRRRYEPTDPNLMSRSVRVLPRDRTRSVGTNTGMYAPSLETDSLCALLGLLRLEDTLYLLGYSTAHVQRQLAAVTHQLTVDADDRAIGITQILTAAETVIADVAVSVYR